MDETVVAIDAALLSGRQIRHTCVNAGKIVLMQDDPGLFEDVVTSDIINADGQAVVWASRILGKPLPERVSGIDLMYDVIELAHRRSYKIFFFGAKQEIVEKVVSIYSQKYSREIVAGFRNGYFGPEDESSIVEEINNSGANILFVAIRSPIKEDFLSRHGTDLKQVGLIMGVGGAFDVISGKLKRAPRWFQDNGLEWLYRLVQEPRRMWRRYLIGNFRFIKMVLRELMTKK